MKLFQIEEPEGAPLEAEGPGAAVGMDLDLAARAARVALALGSNAEILPGADGERGLAIAAGVAQDLAALETLLLALRSRAEKQLHRPVTHAVIAATGLDPTRLAEAALRAGLTLLRLMDRSAAASLAPATAAADAAALGAAIAAEDLAPSV